MKEEKKDLEIEVSFKGALEEYAKLSDEEIAARFNKDVLPEIIKTLHTKPQSDKSEIIYWVRASVTLRF
jgi:Ni,Fe-hydrogenase III component G